MGSGVYAALRRISLTVVATTASTGAWAVEILDASVDKEDGVYHVIGNSLIDASPEFIYSILIDFDNFHKISNSITDTHVVESSVPGELLGYTRIEACVMFFCRTAERVERITASPSTVIEAEAIPDQGDFVIYHTRWALVPQGDVTRVTYKAEFQPDFWMPPLISTWAIKRKLVSSAENLGARIEYLAKNGLTLAQIQVPPPTDQ